MNAWRIFFLVLGLSGCSIDSADIANPVDSAMARIKERDVLYKCIDEATGDEGDTACLALTMAGHTTRLQHSATTSDARQRISNIRRRALRAVATRVVACNPSPSEEEGACPPHALRDEFLTWPNTGKPWFIYYTTGSSIYERCNQKTCRKCNSTTKADCVNLEEKDLPDEIREMLIDWGWTSAY